MEIPANCIVMTRPMFFGVARSFELLKTAVQPMPLGIPDKNRMKDGKNVG